MKVPASFSEGDVEQLTGVIDSKMKELMAQIGKQNEAVALTNKTLKEAEEAIFTTQVKLEKYIEKRVTAMNQELTNHLQEAKTTLSI